MKRKLSDIDIVDDYSRCSRRNVPSGEVIRSLPTFGYIESILSDISPGKLSDYLKKAEAALIYLSQADAASTYLTTAVAENTYLSKFLASITYLKLNEDIDMSGQHRIKNLPSPADVNDAASVVYCVNNFQPKNADIDLNSHKIINMAEPTSLTDGVNLNYLNNHFYNNYSDILLANGKRVKQSSTPLNDIDLVNLAFTNNSYIAKGSNIDMANNTIINLPTPTVPSNPVTLAYGDATYAKLSGSTHTGQVILSKTASASGDPSQVPLLITGYQSDTSLGEGYLNISVTTGRHFMTAFPNGRYITLGNGDIDNTIFYIAMNGATTPDPDPMLAISKTTRATYVDYLSARSGIIVGSSTNMPNSCSIMDLKSTTQGALLPRMTTAQRLAIASPVEGLMVFDTDTKLLYLYQSSVIGWKHFIMEA